MTTDSPLRPLLARLLKEADTGILQHTHDPRPDEWFAGRGDYGDLGTFPTPEDAIVALVRRLWLDLDEARAERDQAEAQLEQLRAEVRAAAAVTQRLADEEGRRRG